MSWSTALAYVPGSLENVPAYTGYERVSLEDEREIENSGDGEISGSVSAANGSRKRESRDAN